MRVVHVAPTPFGGDGLLGGGERYPLELARALARHVDVELVTFGRHPVVAPPPLRLRVLRPVARWRRHPAHPIAPALPFALGGSDLVHTHHAMSAPSVTAAVVSRAAGRPVVTTDHGLGAGPVPALGPALFARHLAVSAYAARTLGLAPARNRVIYGGADPARFHPDPAVARNAVLFVGRITPHKGIDRLLEALPPGVPLLVAGTTGHDRHPPERDYPSLLRRLGADRDVAFLGPVPDADLPALYRRARALVLPTVEVTCYGRRMQIPELLGLATVEAMASGTPVIASRIGGVPEVVDDETTGFLVEPGNVEELRERISQLVGDPALAERMGRAARQHVLERLTWDACARRCLAAYEELLAAGAR